MSRYRSIPQEVDAIQWTGGNVAEVLAFGADGEFEDPGDGLSMCLVAGKDGAQGLVPVPVGHWIVRAAGDLTDHWPVEPAYFAAKYEPADGERRRFPTVAGTCPSCGRAGSLFLGVGGHVICGASDCRNPTVVDDLLHRPRHHVLEVGIDGWALQHAITCFPNLLDCDTHQAVAAWTDTLAGPPAPIGRYRLVPVDGGRFQLAPEPVVGS